MTRKKRPSSRRMFPSFPSWTAEIVPVNIGFVRVVVPGAVTRATTGFVARNEERIYPQARIIAPRIAAEAVSGSPKRSAITAANPPVVRVIAARIAATRQTIGSTVLPGEGRAMLSAPSAAMVSPRPEKLRSTAARTPGHAVMAFAVQFLLRDIRRKIRITVFLIVVTQTVTATVFVIAEKLIVRILASVPALPMPATIVKPAYLLANAALRVVVIVAGIWGTSAYLGRVTRARASTVITGIMIPADVEISVIPIIVVRVVP